MSMPLLDRLRGKNILLLGLGAEGISTYAFLRGCFPHQVFGLADRLTKTQLSARAREIVQSDAHVRLHLGEGYLGNLEQYDLVFRSPGVPPSLPRLIAARRSGVRLTSNTQLFFDLCPGMIIGVTGTAGKSTTVSLIFQILSKGGIRARLTGNIGIPPLSSLEGPTDATVFVTELSSHQLADLERSPHVAVLLDIVPEHGDYYDSFETYVRAKSQIVRHQTECDYTVYSPSHPVPTKIARKSKATKIVFGLEPIGREGCFLKDESLVFYSGNAYERILSIHEIPLPGRFNLENVMPSVVVGRLLRVPLQSIANSVTTFIPLEHRLEPVGCVGGVAFYNDSLSTVPETAIAAIQALAGKRIVLLAGGFDRGQDYAELARTILCSKVVALVLFPTTGEGIWREIIRQTKDGSNLPKHIFVDNMSEGVQCAYEIAHEGDVVLLSPASPSFGVFVDYKDRGNQFKAEMCRIAAGIDDTESNHARHEE